MPLKVRFLTKCHTEKRRGRRIIKTKQWKSRRHRRCIERRSLFANFISNLYTKRLPQNSYQESVRYTSVALCAVGTSVTLHYLRPLRDSVFPHCQVVFMKTNIFILQKSDKALKKYYIISNKTSMNSGKNTYKKQVCNLQRVSKL